MVEEVKWILKKYGFLIALIVIVVIVSSIVLGKRGPEKNAEVVWEPQVETLSRHTSMASGNEEEMLSNNT
ncbi:MAG: ATP F0F1 synthase subunit B, partial [Lachnospiraceae bacterium]|nr:ATP F0F1 synthase subunit B [Lachnospiraceae bacterium]